MGCLDDETIAAFAGGSLPAQARAGAERHMGGCSACRQVLAAYARAFLSSQAPPEPAPPSSTAEAAPEEPERGASLGRYVLLWAVGAGGMGTVHAAYDPELDRKVALKVLLAEDTASGSSGGSGARLLREAQAMARLTHPNVVRIYDVGTMGGRVFLAMEFIDGVTLGYRLKQGHQGWRELLGLFTQAGRGLAAAHAAGLVHRDFKPDNVLIASDGRVLVSDFGIAREVGQAQPHALPTPEHRPLVRGTIDRTGTLVGTPAYMAPEQLLGQRTDARSDQFSFCVSLFEGLTGTRPFALEELDGPLEPSAAARVAQAHGVPGWLWKVLARGLRREPAQRFPSMEALLAALERDPVRTRRRWLGAGALVVGLALAAGSARSLSSRQALLCTGAERKLAGVWDAPRQEALRRALLATDQPYAPAAWQLVLRRFEAFSSQWTAMHTEACEATRVRGEQSEQMLTLRMLCLERRLEQARALGDILASADVEVLRRAGDISGALPDLSDCADAAALAAVPAPADPTVRQQVARLREQVARALALTRAGRYAEARPLARETADAARALKYAPLEAEALFVLGEVLDSSGEPAAEQALLEAAWGAEASRGDELAARAWTSLVYVGGVSLDKPELARLYAAGARSALARLGGERGRLRADLLDNLGGMALSQGQYTEALEFHREAATLRERVLGPESPELARSLFNMANVYLRLARYAEALALLERVLALQERTLGAEHPALMLTLNTQGAVWLEQGLLTEALSPLERARLLAEQSYGPDSPRLTPVLGNLGTVLRQLGRPDEALVHQRRAYALRQRVLGQEHPQTALSMMYLSVTLGELGQLEEARRLGEQALSVSQKRLGPEHAQVAFALQNLGELALHARQWRRAAESFEKAIAVTEKALNPRHPSLVSRLAGAGQARLELRELPGALALLERAVSLGQEVPGKRQALAEARLRLAQALLRARREPQRARELARQAREVFAAQPTRQGRELTAQASTLLARLAQPSP